MRGFLISILAVVAIAAGFSVAEAQVRFRPSFMIGNGPELVQVQPRLRAQQQPAQISPSEAVMIALRTVPNAKPLGVKQRGNIYVVRLRSGNQVVRVGVNSATGAVIAIP